MNCHIRGETGAETGPERKVPYAYLTNCSGFPPAYSVHEFRGISARRWWRGISRRRGCRSGAGRRFWWRVSRRVWGIRRIWLPWRLRGIWRIWLPWRIRIRRVLVLPRLWGWGFRVFLGVLLTLLL